jgi:hypothetical protein
MGREIRMVPPNWEHPKEHQIRLVPYEGLQYVEEDVPMYDRRYEDAVKEWKEAYAKWESGHRPDCWVKGEDPEEFWDWEGMPPDKKYYRPWKEEDATWFQLWQTVSEGTPVSPPFATREELALYLAENGDYWDQRRGHGGWGGERASAFVNSGWAQSFMTVVSDQGARIFESKDIPLEMISDENGRSSGTVSSDT